MDIAAFVAENLQQVRMRMAEAALRAGRNPETVRLVAVSKFFSVEAVWAAWNAGQREFGESRPEEAQEKIAALRARLSDAEFPLWHMIGHIQRRKAPLVVPDFSLVHSMDRLSLAQKLSALAVAAQRTLPVLLECNVSGEVSKDGFALAGWETDAGGRERFFQEVTELAALPGLQIEGLMTMAPPVDDPEATRPVFASLRALRDALRERFPASGWDQLSMGMTDDFEAAIAEGATLVRVGRAIFGERVY